MFSPDDDFLAEHHLDLRNYYPHHHQPPSTASASVYRNIKSNSASGSSALSNYSRAQYQDSNLGSSIPSTASRISIREANDHLQLLHQRVGDLEDIIRSQGSTLSGKDIEFRRQIQELKETKERQISELSMVIAKLEGKNQELASEIQEKSDHLNGCQQRLLMLDQILNTSIPLWNNSSLTWNNFRSITLKWFNLQARSGLRKILETGWIIKGWWLSPRLLQYKGHLSSSPLLFVPQLSDHQQSGHQQHVPTYLLSSRRFQLHTSFPLHLHWSIPR